MTDGGREIVMWLMWSRPFGGSSSCQTHHQMTQHAACRNVVRAVPVNQALMADTLAVSSTHNNAWLSYRPSGKPKSKSKQLKYSMKVRLVTNAHREIRNMLFRLGLSRDFLVLFDFVCILFGRSNDCGWAGLNIGLSWGMVSWDIDWFPPSNWNVFIVAIVFLRFKNAIEMIKLFFPSSLKKSLLHAQLNA